MQTKTTAHKIVSKKYIFRASVIGYLFCHWMLLPLFAEYMEAPAASRAIARPEERRGEDDPISGGRWRSVESDFFTIRYGSDADLKKIEKRLRKRKYYIGVAQTPGYLSDYSEKIAYRMDLLFRRAQDILGMHPRDVHLQVKIFKDRRELMDEYYRIFGKRANLKAFYIYRYDTIYANEEDISDSVIAHEMGHAIVDHYFVVRPPEQVREILAMYVDMHLDD